MTLILGPSAIPIAGNGIHVLRVHTAEEMYQATMKEAGYSEIIIMSAAVSDYTPVSPKTDKIKKKGDKLVIELKKTKDILKSIGEQKKPSQVLVGFALETSDERKNAQEKLFTKNADLMVLNSLNEEGAGFGYDTNTITIFGKDGTEMHFENKPKQEVARDIVHTIIRKYYA